MSIESTISENIISDIQKGICSPNADPIVIKEKPITAWVDGNNGLGTVVSNFCTELAILKAKKYGVGYVAVKSNKAIFFYYEIFVSK